MEYRTIKVTFSNGEEYEFRAKVQFGGSTIQGELVGYSIYYLEECGYRKIKNKYGKEFLENIDKSDKKRSFENFHISKES